MKPFDLPRDPDGEVLPHDHPDLSDGSKLIRRISSEYVVPDNNRGGKRLSSAVFKNDPRQGYLSVDSEACIISMGQAPAIYVTSPTWIGALIISVDDFRSFDDAKDKEKCWKIGMHPIKDVNPCHAAIWGKIRQGQSNDLQKRSEWLVQIPDVAKLSEHPAPETDAA